MAITLTGVLLLGCTHKRTARIPAEIYDSEDIPARLIGDYSKEEVGAVQAALARLAFPAARTAISELLPRPLDPFPIMFVDSSPTESRDGPSGGNIQEYWLNKETALRVATAYHSNSEPKIVWVVMLTRTERQSFKRSLY